MGGTSDLLDCGDQLSGAMLSGVLVENPFPCPLRNT
jgi:hypothetical protein